MKDYILYISIVFFLSLFASCDRGLLDDMPLNKKSAYDIFKDSTRVDDFVLGLYPPPQTSPPNVKQCMEFVLSTTVLFNRPLILI